MHRYRAINSITAIFFFKLSILNEKLMQNIEDEMRNTETLHEDFEIFMDEERASIDVPDFRDGRGGRFIHDFGANITGMIFANTLLFNI